MTTPQPDEKIVQLSSLDSNGVENISLTICYAFDRDGLVAEPSQVDEAMKRVCEKWRLLAGRLEWSKELRVWTVRVPIGPLPIDYRTHAFSTTTSDSPLGISLPPLLPSSAQLLTTQPPISAFRSPLIPTSSSSLASSKHPLIGINISTFSDYTTLGLTFPHGVFDATGMGIVAQALSAELNGEEWEVPPMSEQNPLEQTLLDSLPTSVNSDQPPPKPNRNFTPFSFLALARFLFAVVFEKWWYGIKHQGVFLGEEVQRKLVEEVKKQVEKETEGKEWVSTGDVLFAWFLKAAYLNEPTNTNIISPCSIFSIRPTLTTSTTPFHLYPHNCIQAFHPPLLTPLSLSQTPLSTLSLLHRHSLISSRTLSFVQKAIQETKEIGGNMLPRKERGNDFGVFTNQSVAGFGKTKFGGEVKGFWLMDVLFTPDNGVPIVEMKGGSLMYAALRRSRWDAMEEELERLNGNGERRVVYNIQLFHA